MGDFFGFDFKRAQRLAVWAGLLAGLAAQPYRPMVFQGESMEPTYGSGSMALTVPFEGSLGQGDIVVFNGPTGTAVKRVAHLPGDRFYEVDCGSGWTYGNDYRLPSRKCSRVKVRWRVVPADHVYLLGDNRCRSEDSRHYGFVSIHDIERLVVSPVDEK